MKKTFLLCAAALAVLAAPIPSFARETALLKSEAETPEKVFNAKSHKLDNGLQIVVVENHRAPVITHMIWYRVGAADEPPGKSGIAHFLEHLLFKGQSYPGLGELAPGEFSKTVRSLGGNDNAFTSQDYTAFFQSIAKEHLETVMRMEAGRVRGMNPPREEVASENKVVLEERRQRTDNDPRAQMAEQLTEALFANHPYSIPVIGWFHEVEKLTWEDARNFHDTWYIPNNAILVVSGDVTLDEVVALAKKTYGIIPAFPLPERQRTTSPPFIAQTSVTLEHPTIQQPVFQRAYRVPATRGNKDESLALQVLEEIMSGGPSSRLYKRLVVEKKIATQASLSYRSDAWDNATLWISGLPAQGHDLKDVEAAIDAELRDLIVNGITPDELKGAITRMQAKAIYARDSLSGPAMIIGHSLITGSTLDDVEYWPRDIENVTAGQIHDAARRYLNPDAPANHPPVTGYLLPKTGTQEQAPKQEKDAKE